MGIIHNGLPVVEAGIFELTDTVWDDLRFPATQIRINPATIKPDFDFINLTNF